MEKSSATSGTRYAFYAEYKIRIIWNIFGNIIMPLMSLSMNVMHPYIITD